MLGNFVKPWKAHMEEIDRSLLDTDNFMEYLDTQEQEDDKRGKRLLN
jgi:hypothetical protein